MKSNKLRVLLVLTLILTLAVSTPISVTAKTKKIGKTQYTSAATYCNNELGGAYKGKVSLYTYCKNAKKYEFYRATSPNGKFKRVATVKAGRGKYINATPGLSLFKARGINGKKKGKFGKVVASYNADLQVESCTANTNDNSIILKLFVDNSNSTSSMDFTTYNGDNMRTEFKLTDAQVKDLYSDKKLFYDEDEEEYYYEEDDEDMPAYSYQYISFDGSMVDENGSKTSATTIGAKETGYVYLKYTCENEDDASAMFSKKMFEYAKKAIDDALNNRTDGDNIFTLTKWLKVKSGTKNYKVGITLFNGGEGLEGCIGNYAGVN